MAVAVGPKAWLWSNPAIGPGGLGPMIHLPLGYSRRFENPVMPFLLHVEVGYQYAYSDVSWFPSTHRVYASLGFSAQPDKKKRKSRKAAEEREQRLAERARANLKAAEEADAELPSEAPEEGGDQEEPEAPEDEGEQDPPDSPPWAE